MSKDVRVATYGLTDLGRTRDHNEDTFLVADLSNAEVAQSGETEHRVGAKGVVLLVADGMGGAAAGEIASQMAAEQVHRFLNEQELPEGDADEPVIGRHLREAVNHANAVIHQYSVEHADMRGMGTTMTVALVTGPQLTLAQIGDSRAYLIRRGEAVQLTKDQSLTQRLVDAGELTEEQAERSERRNIILQALGPDPRVQVIVTHQPLQKDDALLLCSDGLSGLVRRDELARIVTHSQSLTEACSVLVALANERGGPDNVTVLVARFSGDDLPEANVLAPGHHRLLVDEDSLEVVSPLPAAGFVTSEMPAVVVPQARPASMWLALLIGLLAAAAWVFLL